MTDGATFKIDADEAGVSEENGVLSVGFADSHSLNGEVDSYVVLQRTVEAAEEDKVGASAIYMELGGQSRAGYGFVKQFILNRNRARILLTENGAHELRLPSPEIEVEFDVSDEQLATLARALETVVFRDTSCYVSSII